MNRALVPLLVLAQSCLCVSPSEADAAQHDAGPPADAGRDAGAQQLIDAGTILYGAGCVSPDRNKIIFILDSRDPEWCAYISMRRWDGGFPTRFPGFAAPEDFKVDDARFDFCRDLELPTSLNQDSIPVDDLWGALAFRLVFEGRPRSYDFDGGIRMGQYVFRTAVFAGLVRDCKGN